MNAPEDRLHDRFSPKNRHSSAHMDRFVPKPALSSCSTCRVRKAELFDHLVGNSEQRRRHGEAERSCGFQIEDELEP